MRCPLAVICVAATLLTAAPGLAREPDLSADAGVTLRPDVEVDPLAYAFAGHSVHAGLNIDAWRVSLGAFAIEQPEWFHGNEGMETYLSGFGFKVDRFFGARDAGPHVGIGGGLLRQTFSAEETGASHERLVFDAGARVGWRWLLGDSGFYLNPWVGVSWAFGGGDVALGEQTFEASQVTFFPTVHLGYRFE